MAVPTSMTDEQLKGYMHSQLATAADALGWSVAGGNYDEILIDALLDLGLSAAADETNLRKLRAAARMHVFAAAHRAVDGLVDFRADGASYNMSQLKKGLMNSYTQALADWLEHDPGYAVTVTAVKHKHDPYTADDDANRSEAWH